MEVVLSLAIGVLGGVGRLAAAAPAHLPGDHGPRAAVVRGQPVHLQHGQPVVDSEPIVRRRASPPTCQLHRPDAAGAGADRDRHRLRDDGAVPGRAAGARAASPARPRRRREDRRRAVHAGCSPCRTSSRRRSLLPLAHRGADAPARRAAPRAEGRSSTSRRACSGWRLRVALLLLGRRRRGAPGSIGVYLPGNWPVPFGIVLVADRLSALMLVLAGRPRARRAAVLDLARWHRAGVHFHPLLPAAADGPQRRLPDRRPVQPVRLLRGDAGRLLRAAAARLGRHARARRAALHRHQPARVVAVPDRRGACSTASPAP